MGPPGPGACSQQSCVVVGIGSCAVDHIAHVPHFPRPNTKLRTDLLLTQGGGNCGNALTAAARLGAAARAVSKVGTDAAGDAILAELRGDGVDTRHVLRATHGPSPSTYVIVDRSENTRTCLHTPGEELLPSDVEPAWLTSALADAAVVYSDGRMTEVAILLARAAQGQGTPVFVEAERPRPHLDTLLSLADVVVTSSTFCQEWSGLETRASAMLASFCALPHAHTMVTALGDEGAVALQRAVPREVAGSAATSRRGQDFDVALKDVMARAEASRHVMDGTGFSITTTSGQCIRSGGIACTSGTFSIPPGSSSGAACPTPASEQSAGCMGVEDAVPLRITAASAAQIMQSAVQDTTGAGDAFLGALLASTSWGWDLRRGMALACLVAACGCLEPGARTGLPRRRDVHGM